MTTNFLTTAMNEPHFRNVKNSFTYNLLNEFGGENLRGKSTSIHDLYLALYLEEPLSDISQEYVSQL
jgi:predicted ATPase